MNTKTAFAPALASQKQLDFIAKLRVERDLSKLREEQITRALAAGLTTRQASNWIELLLQEPRSTGVAVGPVGPSAISEALEDVIDSKYAVPSRAVMIPGLEVRGDLLFLEVRTFRGHKYLRRLHGAPGRFQRTKLTASQTIALAAVIKGKHVELSRLFGEHYACCGRCGAELTDQKSREIFLGPECRKVFGV